MARALGISRTTFSRWLTRHIQQLPPLSQSVQPAAAGDVLELDELWSFVRKKAHKRWLWVALNRRTRQIVAYTIGDRSAESVQRLWKRLPDTYCPCHSFSDFWHAYEHLLHTGTHQMLGKETGQTAHVERWNGILRQRLARYVRKTLSFSKSDRMYHLVTKWFIWDYNLSLTL